MKIREIAQCIEEYAPLSYQEGYDNSGLIVGNPDSEVQSALVSIDCTEEVIEEAIRLGAGMVISHHPIVFDGLKRFTGRDYVEKTVIKAIRENIAIYAAHTNLDNTRGGVSAKIGEKLGLINGKVLMPATKLLRKLQVYCPQSHAETVRSALFASGAGHIGNYQECSFNSSGSGTFKAGLSAKPFSGEIGALKIEAETKIEVLFREHQRDLIIENMLKAHPYEEVAYDILALENEDASTGSGWIGNLPEKMTTMDFLQKIKEVFQVSMLRHTELHQKEVLKIAVCGGSGSFLLNEAIRQNADLFLSADFKYHQFFDANQKITIADIGHYESEQFTTELLKEILIEKFPTFAVHFSEVKTNPVNYL